jgi:hypothetical protein
VVADLQQKPPGFGELQDVGVLGAVAADPNVVFVVDEHAVLVVGPLVIGRWPAPRLQKVSGQVEFKDGRRRDAAIGLRRVESRVLVVVVQSSGAAVYPNMIVRVDKDTADLTEHPVVRQRLRPGRIRFEPRHGLRRRGNREGEEREAC